MIKKLLSNLYGVSLNDRLNDKVKLNNLRLQLNAIDKSLIFEEITDNEYNNNLLLIDKELRDLEVKYGLVD